MKMRIRLFFSVVFLLVGFVSFGQVKVEWLVKPEYNQASSFMGRTAVVMRDRKRGLIDNTGQELFFDRYNHFKKFSEGIMVVRKGRKYGGINNYGKEVIPFQYSDFESFSEGLAAVSKDGKWGYIDKTGKIVIPLKYDYARSFLDGAAIVSYKGKLGSINNKGIVIVPFLYGGLQDFSDGLAPVNRYASLFGWGYIDKFGKLAIPFLYRGFGNFINGLTRVSLNRKWGYINKKNQFIVPFRYDYALDFRNGLAVVGKKNKYGYINVKGEEVVKLQYQYIRRFSEGLSLVKKGGKYGFIDRKGNEVIEIKHENASVFSEGLAAVKQNQKWGFINKSGNLVIDYQFDRVFDFSEGFAVVKQNGKWGFIENPLKQKLNLGMSSNFKVRNYGRVKINPEKKPKLPKGDFKVRNYGRVEFVPRIQIIFPQNITSNRIYKTLKRQIILKGKVIFSPKKQITINGQKVNLEKDNTFEVNLPVTYRNQTYSIEAVAYNSKKTVFSFSLQRIRQTVRGTQDKIPPRIKITSPTLTTREIKKKGKAYSRTDNLVIEGTVEDASGIKSLTVNGNNISLINGKVFRYHITLKKDITEVAIIATDQAQNKSAFKFDIVKLKQVNQAGVNSSKANLYMVSIGISKYANKEYNLNYAAADADTIFNIFNLPQNKQLFNDIKSKRLLNQQATRKAIIKSFQWLRENATPKDLIVLFIASHGFNENGNFYILPHDGDPNDLLSDGVDWSLITQTISQVKCRKVIFLDACHSAQLGEDLIKTRGKVDIRDAIKVLNRKEDGLAIFSSTSKFESSYESELWKQGLFTQALKEGLLKGKADQNDDGIVYLSELHTYILEKAKTLRKDLEGYLKRKKRQNIKVMQHPLLHKIGSITQLPLVILK